MNPKETHAHSQKPAEDAIVPANASVPAASDPSAVLSPVPNPVLYVLQNTVFHIEKLVEDFSQQLGIDTNLTGRERLRLFGVKSRNYGFINKAFAIAGDNPAFRPPNFSLGNMSKTLEILEEARQLTMVVEQLRAVADDILLKTCDTAYRDALRIYGNLREQSRANVSGAKALFDELLQFFTLRRRRPGEAEPTEHELERDFRSMLHGHTDGEIIIKNESPHLSGAVHEVVDEVHRRGKHDGAEIKVKSEE